MSPTSPRYMFNICLVIFIIEQDSIVWLVVYSLVVYSLDSRDSTECQKHQDI